MKNADRHQRAGWLRESIRRLVGTIRPTRSDAELEEELRLHITLAAEAERARTSSTADSARSAALRWGGVSQAMDALRDQRRVPSLSNLAQDVRDGVRTLRRSPTFTAVSLLTLTLGVGATVAVFSVVNSVVLEPLAYPKSDRLVGVWLTAPGAPGVADVSGDLRLSASMYFTFADENTTFQHLGIWYDTTATVTGLAEPEEVRAIDVSGGVLEALEVPATIGRLLGPADQQPGAPQVVMLGYGYWQRAFGGSTAVIGQRLAIDAVPQEIVGVMPPGFAVGDVRPDLIIPAQFDRRKVGLPGFGFEGLARLKPGVTLAQADADITRMVPIWMNSWPMAAGISPHVYESWRIAPAIRFLKQDVVGHVANVLWVLLGTVGVLMLIACANVANLLLVRAEARQRELALRTALGAGRARIVQALIVESLLLGLTGGLLGLGLAALALQVLLAIDPPNLPRLPEVAIDGRVLVFAFGLSLLSGLAFGVIPAFRSAGPRIAAVLHSGGRTASESRQRRRTRDGLVVTQVALAFVLVVCSGLMVRTFRALSAVDPGFANATHVQTLRISIPTARVKEPARVMQLEHDLVNALAAIPGVAAVGFASTLPMDGQPPDWDDVMPEGRIYQPGEMPGFRLFKAISPGYFRATGITILAGRDYNWTDLDGRSRVAIVSENLARELWGSPAAAIGKRIHTLPQTPWREVTGVVADTRDNGVDQPAPATVYWPAFTESLYHANTADAASDVTFTILSDRAGAASFMAEVRKAIWSRDPNLPLASVRTLEQIYQQSLARTSFALLMLAIAAALGLVLGVVGIYGIVSYAVSQRRREIGIRVALGAATGTLKLLFVREGLVLSGMGVVLGAVAAAGLTRLMSSLLFATRPLDPVTYATAPVLLAVAATLASYLPARRAARVDPVQALKAD